MGLTIFDFILSLNVLGDARPGELDESTSFRQAVEKAAEEQIFYNPSSKPFDFDGWWDKHVTFIKDEIDVSKGRWQEYSGAVYQIGNRYLYVYGVSQEYNEMNCIGDGGESFNFSEVYPHSIVTKVFKSTPQDPSDIAEF